MTAKLFKADADQGAEGNGEVTRPSSNVVELPVKRRGRPVGSKNRIGREAREVLKAAGPKVMRQAIRMALGLPCVMVAAPGHKPRRQVPSEAAQSAALKMLVDRIEPVLKSVETSGVTSSVNVVIEGDDAALLAGKSPRHAARAILNMLYDVRKDFTPEDREELRGQGIDILDSIDAKEAAREREIHEEWLTRVAGSKEAASLRVKAEADGATTADDRPHMLARVGDSRVIADGLATITLNAVLPDGRNRYALSTAAHGHVGNFFSEEDAEAKADRLHSEGRL